MKKTLFVAIAGLMTMAASAQQIQLVKSMNLQMPAAAQTVAAEGEDLWGYYLGDESGLTGLGTGSQATLRAAIYVPGSGALSGAQITALNIPVVEAMTNVSVWGGTSVGSKTAFNKSVGNMPTLGYTRVDLDEPVSIPADGLYVGYTMTSTGGYPIGMAAGEADGALYIATAASGAMGDESHSGYGVSGLQIFVTGMDLPDNGVTITDINCEAAGMGGKGTFTLKLSSDSNNPIQNIGYVLTIDGVETNDVAFLDPQIPAGLLKSGSVDIEFDAPATVGSFAASVAVKTVNGVENEGSQDAVDFTINTVTRVVPRFTVIEEFTGTGCGWCPRGWVGMEAVKNNQSDRALVIAWHKYNSNDPMYAANYAKINFSGAPQCTVDRKTFPDPYYGESEESILECVNKYNRSVPTVDIKVEANFETEENKNVVVKANTEFLTNVEGYTVAFVLTADSLSGTTSAWKQSNYYYQYTVAQAGILDEMPELAEFCKNGTYGRSSVSIVFNDVLIGSTYNSNGKSLVTAFTADEQVAGNTAEREYSVAMPTKSALVNALSYDKIYVTVLVIDKTGKIANATRTRVLGYGESSDEPGDDVVTNTTISPISYECQMVGESASPNMNWVAGFNYVTYAPIVWNTVTNEVIDYAEYEEGTFHAINNSGLAVGDDGNADGFALAIKADGTKIDLFVNEGEIVTIHDEVFGDYEISTGDAGSAAWAVSEDGKTIAGYYFLSDYTTIPCIWNENGDRVDLPLPTSEEAGFEVNGGEVRWMTPDATVLAGMLIDNYATWPACIWRKNAQGGYDYEIVCKDFWEEGFQQGKPYMVFTPAGLSQNGEWLTLQTQEEFDDWDFSIPQPAMNAARLNLNTMALEIIIADNGANLSASGIANDGTMLAMAGDGGMIGRSGYICAAGSTTATSIDEFITAIDDIEGLLSNSPCTLSADGKTIQGFAMDDTEDANFFTYIIKLDDTTGINKVDADNQTIATTDGRIYNIYGQQVTDMNGHGLFIIGGKKVLK